MKLRSVVLTAIVVLSMATVGGALLPGTAAAAGNTGGDAGNTPVDVAASDLSGSGTAEDPYVVTNASELQAMEDDVDAHYELGNDIDATETENWTQSEFTELRDQVYIFEGQPTVYYELLKAPVEPGSVSVTDTSDGSSVSFTLEDAETGNISISEETDDYVRVTYQTQEPVTTGFDPVGTERAPFTGSFDGNGHTIDGVTTDRTNVGTDVGLFGRVGSDGTLSNVTLTGVNHSVENPILLNRFPDTGGLVGHNEGVVENVSVSGHVDSAESNVGGVAGANDGTVNQSSADAYVANADASSTGGLVGENRGTVTESYATGDVEGDRAVGGLVGVTLDGQIADSYATGNVTGNSGVGGLAGEGYLDDLVFRSYAVGNVTGETDVSGLVGDTGFETDPIQNSYWDTQTTTQEDFNAGADGLVTILMTGNNARSSMSELDFANTWAAVERESDDGRTEVAYPVLRNNTQTPEPGLETVTNASDYDVRVDSVNGSVQPYEYVEVETTIENVGRADGTQTVELRVNGTTVDTASVTLDSLEQTEQTFRYATDETDTPAVTATVVSENESVTNTVSVVEEPEPVCRIVGYDGSGTATDPYQVENATQLQCLVVNDPDGHYVLTGDIDASSTAEWNDGAGFQPVGSNVGETIIGQPFTGSLDGDGHTITGLTVDRPDEYEVGLFGELSGGATVENLTLESVDILGGQDVGGVVGYMETDGGTVENVHVTGDVNTSTDYYPSRLGGVAGNVFEGNEIIGVTANVTVSGGDDRVGGIAGNFNGRLVNATATGYVDGENRVGGLVGEHGAGTITASSATATVTGGNNVGGLVGLGYADARASYATGNVSGADDVGGLVGDLQSGAEIDGGYATGTVSGDGDVGGLVGYLGGTVRQGYAAGEVSGSTDTGGLVGDNEGDVAAAYWDIDTTTLETSSGSGTGLTTAEMTGSNASENMSAFDFDTVWSTQSDDYPVFRYQSGNAPPVPDDDSYISEGGVSVDAPGVLDNDIDYDGDSLSVTRVVDGASNGNVTIAANGSLEYTPDEGVNGAETITYEVSDGTNTSTGTVTIYATGGSGRQVSDNEWTSWHLPSGTNYDSEIAAPRTPVTELWNTEFPGEATSNPVRPIVVNDTVYSSTYASTFAMDAQTGELLWDNASVPGTYLGGLAYSDDRLFVSTSSGDFHALDAETGEGIWSRDDISTYSTAPATLNETVFIAGEDSDVYALNATTGETIWSVTYDEESASFPADYAGLTAVNGTVYVSLNNGSLMAHDTESGDTLWRTPTGYSESTPAVTNGTVYITDSGTAPYLHAIDAETGEFVWNATSEYGYTGVSVTESLVYVATCGDSVFAYDTETGEQEWSRSGMGCAYDISEPVAVGEYVYVTNYDADTLALNRYSGETEYTITNPTESKFTSPTPYRGTLYFADRFNSGGISAYGGPERPYLNATNTVAGQEANLTVLQEYRNATVADASVTIEGEDVTLDSGSDGVTTYRFPEGGTYPVTITAENTTLHRYVETTRTVDVRYRQDFSVAITGTDSPVEAGSTLTVNATVTNVGDLAGTQTVTLEDTNGTTVANRTVSLAADESADLTLNWTTDGDAESGFVSVASANDTATRTVTVESESGGGGGGGGPTPSPNEEPVAANDSYSVPTDGPLTVSAANGTLANDADPDGEELTAALAGGPTNGTLNLSADGSFEYAPDAGFNGTDTFTYEVTDGDGDTATATVSLTVPSSANVTVSVDSTTVDGGTRNVTVTLQNRGDAAANRTVSLSAGDGTVVERRNVTVAGGTETSLTLEWATDEAGNGTLTVASADAALTRNVTVAADDGGGAVPPEDDGDIETVIVDAAPERPGTTVEVAASDFVETITFGSAVDGTITVSPVVELSNETRAAMVAQTNVTESMTVLTAVDIGTTAAAVDDGTTLNLTVPAADVEDTDDVRVLHRTDDGWEHASTTASATGNGTVRVTTTVESLSLFAVVETGVPAAQTTDNATAAATATPTDTETPTAAETTAADGPGFGVTAAVVAVLAAALLARRRR